MKNNLYRVPNNKEYNNYQKYYYTQHNEYRNNPIDEINKLFDSKNFIYHAKVKITRDNITKEEIIIGKVGNKLINTNKELIPIEKIQEFIIV